MKKTKHTPGPWATNGLIVAAPELYEIAEAVAHIGVDFGYGDFEITKDHVEKARVALAKARGEVRE